VTDYTPEQLAGHLFTGTARRLLQHQPEDSSNPAETRKSGSYSPAVHTRQRAVSKRETRMV
jgi:hypothetical protein